MYFGLLNRNLLWIKRFDDRVSEITSKNCRKAVFLWKNLRRKENIVSITLKTLYFYVFWLAESKFVMEKEVWQPSFRDNLKKLSKSYVSVGKLEKKKKHCFHHIQNTLFYVFCLAASKFHIKKRFGSWVSEITSKNCLKAVILWKNLRRKKNIVSITLKVLYFMYFGLLNPNLLWKKRSGSRVSEITLKNCRKAVFVWTSLRRKKPLFPSH